jgi:hypothetical protein
MKAVRISVPETVRVLNELTCEQCIAGLTALLTTAIL